MALGFGGIALLVELFLHIASGFFCFAFDAHFHLHLLMVVKPISGSEVARRGANLSSFSCATFAVFRGFDARTGHAEIIRFAGAMRHAYRRSAERRVGKGSVSRCIYRWWRSH